VAELVCHHALQFLTLEPRGCTTRHGDGGIGRRIARGERVDAILVFEHVHLGHGDARRDRHLLDDVVQSLEREVAVLRSMRVPPSDRATAPPPARNERVLKRLAPQMMASTTTLVPSTAAAGDASGSAAPYRNTTTASIARTTSTTEIRNATRSQRVFRRASSCWAKKSI
jgi:hypothetical protein